MEDKILESVVDTLEYNFIKDILVKPLEAIKIEKEIKEPVPNGKQDEEGFNLYDTEVTKREVESDFGKGVILALPEEYKPIEGQLFLKVGDTIVYPVRFSKSFDLFRDSQLVRPYDVIAVVK